MSMPLPTSFFCQCPGLPRPGDNRRVDHLAVQGDDAVAAGLCGFNGFQYAAGVGHFLLEDAAQRARHSSD